MRFILMAATAIFFSSSAGMTQTPNKANPPFKKVDWLGPNDWHMSILYKPDGTVRVTGFRGNEKTPSDNIDTPGTWTIENGVKCVRIKNSYMMPRTDFCGNRWMGTKE
jgi:hypothetical protein